MCEDVKFVKNEVFALSILFSFIIKLRSKKRPTITILKIIKELLTITAERLAEQVMDLVNIKYCYL